MRLTPDQVIDRFSRLTHQPRGPYARSEDNYRQLLERLPIADRPVVGPPPPLVVGHRHRWRAAAGIALIAGIGIALASVYTFRHELFPGAGPSPTVAPVPPVAARTLVFTDAPLSAIVAQLSEAYHADIVIATPALASYRLTATFSTDEAIADVLDALCQAGGFTYRRVDGDNRFILSSP